MNCFSKLEKVLSKEQISEHVSMASYTTFQTGGCADLLLQPENETELQAVLAILSETGDSYFILGRGSNLLVSDQGYHGVLISLRKGFQKIQVSGNQIFAEAGLALSEVARVAYEHSLGGFSFASGIPGTLGGALFMNAGAYDSEMKNVTVSVRAMQEDGSIRSFSKDELDLSYRHSVFKENSGIILSAVLSGIPKDQEEIKALTDEFSKRRREKQPLEYGSAGSTFKRPEGYFAGKLIEDAGLKGFRIGDAQVSEKHAGFVINRGHATSKDVYDVIKEVQKTVYEKFRVNLEPEVRFLGEF